MVAGILIVLQSALQFSRSGKSGLSCPGSLGCKSAGLAMPSRRSSSTSGSCAGLVLFRFKRGNDNLQQRSCLKEWPTATGYILARHLTAMHPIAPYPGPVLCRGRCLARPEWQRTIKACGVRRAASRRGNCVQNQCVPWVPKRSRSI